MNRLDFLPQELQEALASTVRLIDEVYGCDTRRFSNELASQHLFDVARYVATVCRSKSLLVAALLHDALEDKPNTRARLYYQYSDRENELVLKLTKPPVAKGETRESRNIRYWMSIVEDNDALLIKLADLLSNIPNKAETTEFRNRFIIEKSQFLELVRDASNKSKATKQLFAQAELALEALRAKKK